MSVAKQHDERHATAGSLPVWWRYALVATATLILCSCRELPPSAGRLDLQAVPTLRAQPRGDQQPVAVSAIASDAAVDHTQPDVTPRDVDSAAAGDVRQAAFRAVQSCPVESPCVGTPSAPCAPCAVVGPSDEYLCDGGDFGLPAAVRSDWKVEGVQPEDAIAHYDTLDGRVIVQPSNRVCVYAPRFAAVRRVRSLMADEQHQPVDVVTDEAGPAQADESTPVATSVQRMAAAEDLGQRPPSLFRQRQQAGGLDNDQAIIDVYSTLAPSADLQVIRTGQVDGSETAKLERAVQSAVAWMGDQAAQVLFENQQAVAAVGLRQPGLVYQTSEPNSPRLRLLKLASTDHAQPGDEITFTLRFDNIGDRVIGNVTVIDNLTTRLEYVPDSARTSVAANFGSEANGVGSLVLRWEIKDPVEPGGGGVVTFRCRVR